MDLQCSAASAKQKRKAQRAHRSAFLFTHRGFSGPSVLDLSHSVTMAMERGTPLPGRPQQFQLKPALSNCTKYGQRRVLLRVLMTLACLGTACLNVKEDVSCF